MDLALAIHADPEAALGPREARVAAAARRGNRADHLARRGIDLLDAVLGDLVEVATVERGAGMRRDVDRAAALAARRIERVQLVAGGEPHLAPVVGEAVHALHAGERSMLVDDLRGCSFHGAILVVRQRRRE
jgi:hypothetical protein